MTRLLCAAIGLVLALAFPAFAGGASDILFTAPPAPVTQGITCVSCGARVSVIQWVYSNAAGGSAASLPSAPAVGDTLYASIVSGLAACPGATTGWSDVLNSPGSSTTWCIEIAKHVVAPSEANSYKPFNPSTVCDSAWIYEMAGVAGEESATVGRVGGGGSATLTMTTTLTHDNDLLEFFSGRTGCGAGNWTAIPAGWTDSAPALGSSNATAALLLASSLYPNGTAISVSSTPAGGIGDNDGGLLVLHP